MSTVINRSTLQVRHSVHTPDYDVKDWIINPILPNCEPRHWEISGNNVVELTQQDKDALDVVLADAAAILVEEVSRTELIRLRSLKLGEDKLIEESVIEPKVP